MGGYTEGAGVYGAEGGYIKYSGVLYCRFNGWVNCLMGVEVVGLLCGKDGSWEYEGDWKAGELEEMGG